MCNRDIDGCDEFLNLFLYRTYILHIIACLHGSHDHTGFLRERMHAHLVENCRVSPPSQLLHWRPTCFGPRSRRSLLSMASVGMKITPT